MLHSSCFDLEMLCVLYFEAMRGDTSYCTLHKWMASINAPCIEQWIQWIGQTDVKNHRIFLQKWILMFLPENDFLSTLVLSHLSNDWVEQWQRSRKDALKIVSIAQPSYLMEPTECHPIGLDSIVCWKMERMISSYIQHTDGMHADATNGIIQFCLSSNSIYEN